MNTYGDPSGNSLAYVTLVGILIFIITFLFLEALYYKALNDEHEIKVVNRPVAQLEGVRHEQRERLNTYGVEANFEESRTRISIPIDRAMQLVIEEGESALKGDPDAAAGNGSASRDERDTDNDSNGGRDAG